MNIIHINTLSGFIARCEKNKAKNFINEIYKTTPHEQYAHSLVAVLLCQVRKKLCEEMAEFYIEEEALWEELFPEDAPLSTDSVIDKMCEAVKNCSKENKKRVFLKAIAYIDENLSDCNLSVGDAARYAGVSPGGLSKIFEVYKSVSPVEYIARRRVEKSLTSLKKSGALVKKIAADMGFSSAESYIRAFKKHYSISPGKWNKQFLLKSEE